MTHPIVKRNATVIFAVPTVAAADPATHGGNPYAVMTSEIVIPCWLKQARPPELELRTGVDRQQFWLRGVMLVNERPSIRHGIEGRVVFEGKTMKFRYHDRVVAGVVTIRQLAGGYPIQGWAILD